MAVSAPSAILPRDVRDFIKEAKVFTRAAKHYTLDRSKIFSDYERITGLFHKTLHRINTDNETPTYKKSKRQLIAASTRAMIAYDRVTARICSYRKTPHTAPDLLAKKAGGSTAPTNFGQLPPNGPLPIPQGGAAVRESLVATTSTALFSEAEILQQHPLTQMKPLVLNGQKFWVSYDEKGRAVLMQIAIAGCTAATAAMLILDCDISPDLTALTTRRASSYEVPAEDLSRAGLIPHLTPSYGMSLDGLRKMLIIYGSAIVFLKRDPALVIGHVVVVDTIFRDLSVRLRDPWYGWSITVKADAFQRCWDNCNKTSTGHQLVQILNYPL